MKAKYIKIVNLIVALLVALFCVGQVFAWLADRRYEDDKNFGGSSASPYFAYGDGTATKKDVNGDTWTPASGVDWDKKTGPYGLESYNHLYNLAWLQNNGRFFDSSTQQETQYYFELADNISIGDYWLPPIGNDDHPFIGIFDGNGHTISGLKITTDKEKLEQSAMPTTEGYVFSNAVGFFGNTGATSKIKNFILDKPYVEVAADAAYATGNTAKTGTVVGLAIGHVGGLAQSIGVLADGKAPASSASKPKDIVGTVTYMDVNRNNYTTFNSILGELAKGTDSSVTGGGHGEGSSGGSGSNFGSSFDVDGLVERLYKIYKGKYGQEYKTKGEMLNNALPKISTSNTYPVPDKGEKVPFSVTSESDYSYTLDAKEVVADNNVGYVLGNENKTDLLDIKFGKPLGNLDEEKGIYVNPGGDNAIWSNGETLSRKNVPKWFYWWGTKVYKSGTSGEFEWNFDQQGANSNSYCTNQGFYPFTKAEEAALPEGIRNIISGDTYNEYAIRMNVGNVYSAVNYAPNNDTKDYWSDHGEISWMGTTYGTDDPVGLPNNGIWFKPATTGKIRFVMYTEDMAHDFGLMKFKRKNATKDNPFKLDEGSDIVFLDKDNNEKSSPPFTVIFARLPAYVLCYYEYEVTQEDLDLGVEFVVQRGSSATSDSTGMAHFIYMDLGASAEVDNDNGEVVEDKISAIDFIYQDVKIAQSAGTGYNMGDFIVGGALYIKSHTSIYFEEIANVLEIAFIRLANEGGKNMSISTKSAEVHATYPEYVTGLVE